MILGPNIMLFGMGARGGEGSGADWVGLGGAKVGMTEIGGVEALRDGPVTKAGNFGSGIGTPSYGT